MCVRVYFKNENEFYLFFIDNIFVIFLNMFLPFLFIIIVHIAVICPVIMAAADFSGFHDQNNLNINITVFFQ